MQFKIEQNKVILTAQSLHKRVGIVAIRDDSDRTKEIVIVMYTDQNNRISEVVRYESRSPLMTEEMINNLMICLEPADENYLSLNGLRNYLPVVIGTTLENATA